MSNFSDRSKEDFKSSLLLLQNINKQVVDYVSKNKNICDSGIRLTYVTDQLQDMISYEYRKSLQITAPDNAVRSYFCLKASVRGFLTGSWQNFYVAPISLRSSHNYYLDKDWVCILIFNSSTKSFICHIVRSFEIEDALNNFLP